MASALSYELYVSKLGVADGVATLDATGKVPVSQLPDAAIETYKGEFATSAALIAAYPTGSLADYAYVTDTLSYWYWNKSTTPAQWVNQQIDEAAYLLLDPAEIAAVPYIIIP